jgi:hypothetical protein
MDKVTYSVTKQGNNGNFTMKGIGYLVEGDLFIASSNAAGKHFVQVLEGVSKYCHQIPKSEAYSGLFYELKTVMVDVTDEAAGKSGEEEKEIVVKYSVWYKKVE